MKKLVVYLCTGVMVFSLAACGRGGDAQDNGQNETNQATEQTLDNPIENITGVDNQQGAEAMDENMQDGTSSEDNNAWSPEMEVAKNAVLDALGDNYWPDTEISQEKLENNIGITSDMYEDYLAESYTANTHVDTLLIIKAKSDKVEAVEEALNEYREKLVYDSEQTSINVGKIQASRIERIGDYVCFVQLGADITGAQENGNDAVIAQCQEQNELVIEILHQNLR